ncbi:DUF4139 domain-containing protein [Thermococcus sp. M39]|uniref:DUF4139 domain-containing protein n=1 Tax=unclassified Thermococcus TaxID=2627626 RepID=UPI00143C0DCD|nr:MULTISPECIES: DUF4139 domain-containing protein [unclassified Thermococcus]NJE07637.1 DUF4139 domain-containing protein [Thermococcus sp. M39]NJE12218.1 DUF4139 domain-containing protein [Thermococcus sp. LS2]
MKKKILGGIFVAFLLLAMIVLHQTRAADESGTLVLYDSARIGVVEKTITLDLKKGFNEVPLEEIEGLNIEEVTVKPLSDKVTVLGIISQAYPSKGVLEANIGKTVTIKLKSGETITGKFLGYKDGKIAVQGDSYYLIEPEEVAYMKLAELGSKAKAQTYAIIQAEEDGKYKFKLIYRVQSIGWSSRYKLYLTNKALLFGYIVIDNPTNKTFEDFKVMLVSGEVNFYAPPQVVMERIYATAEKAVAGIPEQPQKIEAFYLYNLGILSVNPFEKKMIPYITQETSFERKYLYESYPYGGSNEIYEIISFKTEKVLPAGIVEIYKEMNDTTVLIGEQKIDHTAKGDILRLKLGRDVDLKGKTEILEQRRESDSTYYKVRITIENFGDETKEVIVRHYKWSGKILSSTVEPIDETAHYVEFKVTVKPGEKKEIVFDYRV